MADAEVGDDVYGEDPDRQPAAVARGRRCSARRPRSTCRRARWRTSSRSACSPRPAPRCCAPTASHVYRYEAAAAPLNSGVQMHPLWDLPDGIAHRDRGRRRTTSRRSRCSCSRTRTWRMSGAPIGAAEMRDARAGSRAPAGCACTSTARASGTRRSRSASPPRELVARRRHRDVLPVEGARRAGRLAAVRPGRRDRRGARAPAAGSAAACARPA